MKNEFNIDQILQEGLIKNELELEQASLAERQLKLISNEIPEAKVKRSRLMELIDSYETKYWLDREKITDSQVQTNDAAEESVQQHLEFSEKRKKLIRSKLKRFGLTQQEFGQILGHNNKSYISELMNGIIPFSLKDIIVISKLLKIDLNILIPTQIPEEEKIKIEQTITRLNKPKVNLDKKEFTIC